MKKLVLSIIFNMILLCGCSGQPEPENNTEAVPSVSPPAASQTAAPTAQPTKAPAKQTLIASAKTAILDKTKNRLNNINIAADVIDGYVIASGETFSFNYVVGKRTKEKGYKEAPVIVEGEKEMDEGGGVCQISTTVYQAAKKAGLKIIERHNHQKDVGYAKKGQDAAVNYGTWDLKFSNTTDYSLMIVATADDKYVMAEIYQLEE